MSAPPDYLESQASVMWWCTRGSSSDVFTVNGSALITFAAVTSSTATSGPHADWFTQSYRYRVSEDATHSDDVEPRDPVA